MSTPNAKLLEIFSSSIIKTINRICRKHSVESKRELLISLSALATKVALDSNLTAEQFTHLIHNIYCESQPPQLDPTLN